MSEEKAWRRRSCGEGTRGSSTGGMASDGCGTSRRGGSGAAPGAGAGGSGATASALGSSAGASSSVLRKRAASGPSRIDARLLGPLAICENLLREIAIGLRRDAVRVVLENGHPLHG